MLKRLASQYGMAGVLLLLCVYYSYATIQLQQPAGAAAAKLIVSNVIDAARGGGEVLIVTRAGDEDVRFADALAAELSTAGVTVADRVNADPRAARVAMRKLDEANRKVAVIATTPEAAQWPVLANLADKGASVAGAKLIFPEPYRWPTFLKKENLLNVANQIVVIAVLAVGMTLVIITGGIDLSVGSLVALSAVLCTMLIGRHGGEHASTSAMVLACAASIAICAVVGAFSGAMVTLFRVPPFIVTLSVMQIASGYAYVLSDGQSIYAVPDSFVWLGRGASLFGIPNGVLLMAILYVAAGVLMARMRVGRYIYAVGGNAEAARLSGVRVWSILLMVYIVSGAMAGVGGVVVASQLKSGAPTYGTSYELYAIAAVVVGGTSLAGGSGKVLGTLIGALIIAVIWNGMNLTGVGAYYQRVVLGFVILVAVLLDMLKKRSWRWPRWTGLGGRPNRPQSTSEATPTSALPPTAEA